MIPRFSPYFRLRDFKHFFKFNNSSIESFMTKFRLIFRINYVYPLPYGRSALFDALKALKIENSEVIISSYTCSVVAHAVVLSNNIPVFVDINPDTFNPNEEDVLIKIGPKTRAVVLSHTFGIPQNSKFILEQIQSKEKEFGNKIWLINDCAHCFDAEIHNRPVYEYGDLAFFGLNISKNLTCIFGGVLATNNHDLSLIFNEYFKLNKYRFSLRKEFRDRVYFSLVYFAFNPFLYRITFILMKSSKKLRKFQENYHMDGQIRFPPDAKFQMSKFAAAIGVEQISKYKYFRNSRIENAKVYNSKLPQLQLNAKINILTSQITYSHFPILVKDKFEFIEYFAKRGVEIGEVIQYSIPELEEYSKFKNEDFPNALYASRHTVNLPIMHSLENTIKIVKILEKKFAEEMHQPNSHPK